MMMMMKRTTKGAVIALLMTGVAFAQTEQGAPQDEAPPGGPAPTTEAPAPAITPEQGAGDFSATAAPDEEPRHHGRGGHGMDQHWRMHHGAMRGGRQGAAFRFSRGEGGPSITIRCAARDSTQECVDAIMPMLDKLLDLRSGARAE